MMAYGDTREAHLSWCKERAREYMDLGDYANAFRSMMSDLLKHEAWQGDSIIGATTRLYAIDPSPENVQRIIEGLN